MVDFSAQRSACRDRLRIVASATGGAPLAEMIDEAKLLRATLVFASGASADPLSPALMQAAVSIELIHLASLLHDDIIDDTQERRGGPAFHIRVGRNRALVVGDLLIVAAFDELAGTQALLPPHVFANALRMLVDSVRVCCLGQLEELDPPDAAQDEARYLDVAAKKTGSLFSLAASLGALVAGASDDEVAELAAFGTAVGVAYQVHDDIRDHAHDDRSMRFTPGPPTFDRTVDAVHETLAHVSPSAADALRTLAAAMLR